MNKEDIVPDVIDNLPIEVAEVTYPSDCKVNLGNKLTPTQVKDIPSVNWNASEDCFYSLCMTDPDAPSRQAPQFREWHHWLVVNIPGNKIEKGDTRSAFIGSGPPEGTGLHRYVFLIFKQAKKQEFDEPYLPNTSVKNREKFSIRKFAAKYNLGDPVAWNFYQAQYDDYVPILYEQLRG